MVRRSRLALGLALANACLAIDSQSAASAQILPRLHVIAFAMRADTVTPRAGQPFHIEIAGRLKEQLSGVDFVVLPNFAGLEPLGDERRAITTTTGTNFSETLTVVAHDGGVVHLGGAYFDAIDPRDGRPKRYYSNDLVLNVIGSVPAAEPADSLRSFLLKLVTALLAVFLVGAVLFQKRARPVEMPASAQREQPPAVIPPESSVQTALDHLRSERSRRAVMALRKELWKLAGARGGETLSEVLSRNGVASGLQTSLQSVERAAFVADSRLAGAIDDAVSAVEAQGR